MEDEIKQKARQLIDLTRVMTLAVSCENIPWSSPVYFVFHDNRFYFFSNENSKHVQSAVEKKNISASIFHDSDHMDQIFGFQMAGNVTSVSKQIEYGWVVKKYVSKFGFLKKVFGPQILENKLFFLEKFKSKLYAFKPDRIFISDNSKTSGKKNEIDLREL